MSKCADKDILTLQKVHVVVNKFRENLEKTENTYVCICYFYYCLSGEKYIIILILWVHKTVHFAILT